MNNDRLTVETMKETMEESASTKNNPRDKNYTFGDGEKRKPDLARSGHSISNSNSGVMPLTEPLQNEFHTRQNYDHSEAKNVTTSVSQSAFYGAPEQCRAELRRPDSGHHFSEWCSQNDHVIYPTFKKQQDGTSQIPSDPPTAMAGCEGFAPPLPNKGCKSSKTVLKSGMEVGSLGEDSAAVNQIMRGDAKPSANKNYEVDIIKGTDDSSSKIVQGRTSLADKLKTFEIASDHKEAETGARDGEKLAFSNCCSHNLCRHDPSVTMPEANQAYKIPVTLSQNQYDTEYCYTSNGGNRNRAPLYYSGYVDEHSEYENCAPVGNYYSSHDSSLIGGRQSERREHQYRPPQACNDSHLSFNSELNRTNFSNQMYINSPYSQRPNNMPPYYDYRYSQDQAAMIYAKWQQDYMRWYYSFIGNRFMDADNLREPASAYSNYNYGQNSYTFNPENSSIYSSNKDNLNENVENKRDISLNYPLESRSRSTPLAYSNSHKIGHFGRNDTILTYNHNTNCLDLVLVSWDNSLIVKDDFPGPLETSTRIVDISKYIRKILQADNLDPTNKLLWSILEIIVKSKEKLQNLESVCDALLEYNPILASPSSSPFLGGMNDFTHAQVVASIIHGNVRDAVKECLHTGNFSHAFAIAQGDVQLTQLVMNKFVGSLDSHDIVRSHIMLHTKQSLDLSMMSDTEISTKWNQYLALFLSHYSTAPKRSLKYIEIVARILASKNQLLEYQICLLVIDIVLKEKSTEGFNIFLTNIDIYQSLVYLDIKKLRIMEIYEFIKTRDNSFHPNLQLDVQKYRYSQTLYQNQQNEKAYEYMRSICSLIVKGAKSAHSLGFLISLDALSRKLHYMLYRSCDFPGWLLRIQKIIHPSLVLEEKIVSEKNVPLAQHPTVKRKTDENIIKEGTKNSVEAKKGVAAKLVGSVTCPSASKQQSVSVPPPVNDELVPTNTKPSVPSSCAKNEGSNGKVKSKVVSAPQVENITKKPLMEDAPHSNPESNIPLINLPNTTENTQTFLALETPKTVFPSVGKPRRISNSERSGTPERSKLPVKPTIQKAETERRAVSPTGATGANSLNQKSTLWSNVSRMVQKIIPRTNQEVFLPDDSEKTIVYDPVQKKYIDTLSQNDEKKAIAAAPPTNIPPPKSLGARPSSGLYPQSTRYIPPQY